jgi:hypothetical protein
VSGCLTSGYLQLGAHTQRLSATSRFISRGLPSQPAGMGPEGSPGSFGSPYSGKTFALAGRADQQDGRDRRRMCGCASAGCGIPSTSPRATTRHPGRRPGRIGGGWHRMLRPGCRAVGLRQVDGMPCGPGGGGAGSRVGAGWRPRLARQPVPDTCHNDRSNRVRSGTCGRRANRAGAPEGLLFPHLQGGG